MVFLPAGCHGSSPREQIYRRILYTSVATGHFNQCVPSHIQANVYINAITYLFAVELDFHLTISSMLSPKNGR